MKCTECGHEFDGTSAQCPSCGAHLGQEPEAAAAPVAPRSGDQSSRLKLRFKQGAQIGHSMRDVSDEDVEAMGPRDYKLRAPEYRPNEDQLRAAERVRQEHQQRRRLRNVIILFLTFVLVFAGGTVLFVRIIGTSHTRAPVENEVVAGEGQVLIELVNAADSTVAVRIGERVVSLPPGDERRVAVEEGRQDTSWTCRSGGRTIFETAPGENIAGDASWTFRLENRGEEAELVRRVRP